MLSNLPSSSLPLHPSVLCVCLLSSWCFVVAVLPHLPSSLLSVSCRSPLVVLLRVVSVSRWPLLPAPCTLSSPPLFPSPPPHPFFLSYLLLVVCGGLISRLFCTLVVYRISSCFLLSRSFRVSLSGGRWLRTLSERWKRSRDSPLGRGSSPVWFGRRGTAR